MTLLFDSYQVNDFSVAEQRLDQARCEYIKDHRDLQFFKTQCKMLEDRAARSG